MGDTMDSGLGPIRHFRTNRPSAKKSYMLFEQLVDGTDTRLRLVSGYKRKFWDCLERSATFVDEIVESVPAPLAVNPQTFIVLYLQDSGRSNQNGEFREIGRAHV